MLLLAVVLVWGATFSLVKAALTATTPLLFNLLRMVLAFAVLAAVNGRSLRGIDADGFERWVRWRDFFWGWGTSCRRRG